MNQPYFERHQEERTGEAYQNRFRSWNQWVENTFGRIVGDGFGVRNWFGPCEEGDWSRTGGNIDKYHIPLAFITALLVFLGAVSYANLGDLVNAIKFVIYLFMGIFVLLIYFTQISNKKVPGEFLHAGYIQDFKKYLKISLLISVIFISIYLLLGSLTAQTITPLIQSITFPMSEKLSLIESILICISIILFFPFIESSFFSGAFTPSFARYIGIIPSIFLISFAMGLFHLIVVGFSPLGVFMAILFGLMTNTITLWSMSKEIAIDSHIMVNSIAFVLKYVKI